MKQLYILALTILISFALQAQNALHFDGVDDYVSYRDYANANFEVSDFTVEFWIKFPDATIENSVVISKRNNCGFENFWNVLISNTGKISLEHSNSDGSVYTNFSSTADVLNNNWNHVAVVRDGMDELIYINGTLDNLQTVSTTNNLTNNAELILGKNPCADQPWADYFKGTIDELRIWTVAKSQTDIQGNMNKELVGDETGLVLYNQFNQGIANGNNATELTPTDLTANNVGGTLTNFALDGTTSNWVGGVVLTTLSNQEIDGDKTIEITPNPASNFIQVSGLKNNESYSVFNALGSTVLTGKVSNQQTINISELSNGLYFLKLESSKPIRFIKG